MKPAATNIKRIELPSIIYLDFPFFQSLPPSKLNYFQALNF
uniref:Uncharacterized protein n=1 Tax=Rhizophora mucronata TaxID=61149 RepID=A0A2P2PQM3_RHIMU